MHAVQSFVLCQYLKLLKNFYQLDLNIPKVLSTARCFGYELNNLEYVVEFYKLAKSEKQLAGTTLIVT